MLETVDATFRWDDTLSAVAWLLTTSLLIVAMRRWSRRLFPDDPESMRWMHAICLSWSLVVAGGIALGSIGWLAPLSLTALVGTFCAVAWFFDSFLGQRIVSKPKQVGGEQKPDGGAGSSAAQGMPAIGREAERPSYGWFAFWLAASSWLLARVALDGLLTFPTDWDTLAYHLPLVDHWIQDGKLYVPKCAFWYCPGNNELLAYWTVGLFSGDFLVALNNVPAIALLGLASWNFMRMLGIRPGICHLAAAVILATRVTWRQAVSAENDVAVAALFFAGLVYGFRFATNGRHADLLLAAMTFGLLCGVKYYALGYAGAVGLWTLMLVVRNGGPRKVPSTLVAGIAGGLLLGGYWYLRNWLATGTPLYPKGFSQSTDVWGQIRPDTFTSTLLGNRDPQIWPLLAESIGWMAGPCHLLAVAVFPSVIVYLLVSAFVDLSSSKGAGQARLWLALGMVLSGVVFLVTPNVVETVPGTKNMLNLKYHPIRFGLCFFSLGIVGLARVSSDVLDAVWPTGRRSLENVHEVAPGMVPQIGRLVKAAIGTVVAAVVLLFWSAGTVCHVVLHSMENAQLKHLILAINILLGVVLIGLLIGSSSRAERAVGAVIMLLLVGGAVSGCGWLGARWHRDFVRHYESRYYSSSVLSSVFRLEPTTERICVCDDRYYPFLGSRRQFDVCRPLWLPDYDSLLAYVRTYGVTVIAARNSDASPRRRYAAVKGWLDAHPETFQPYYQDEVFTVVRVREERVVAPAVSQLPGGGRDTGNNNVAP
ncbi:MAG: hypothetical protein KatS3mg110_4069 [Pirellulaceae bacterium]|nr:MAG: hypothetical protein KatS3mg110_4069 [Pirellulaceae bacterium]